MESTIEHKMTTGTEVVFRPTHDPNIYREVTLHWLHFVDRKTNKTVRSKLNNQIKGRLYKRVDKDSQERSLYGEVEYTFPNEDEPTRLIALGMDFDDTRYGRR